jgi:hypothetical protein
MVLFAIPLYVRSSLLTGLGRFADMYQEARPYGVPKEYVLDYCGGKEVKVTITLFDANHCPGSTM